MMFGREIEDPAGGCFVEPKFADFNFSLLTQFLILHEHCWVTLLELQCDTGIHHTDAIDGIDKRLAFACEDVALVFAEHKR